MCLPQHLAIVMEYVGGGNLQQFVEGAGRLPEWQARCFFQQLILALQVRLGSAAGGRAVGAADVQSWRSACQQQQQQQQGWAAYGWDQRRALLAAAELHTPTNPPATCRLVQYCHANLRIAHRDIKLGNVLLNTKYQIPILKLCDFGYSKAGGGGAAGPSCSMHNAASRRLCCSS